MAGGRQERTDRPAERAGRHPPDRNACGGAARSAACRPARRAYRVATPTRQIDAAKANAAAPQGGDHRDGAPAPAPCVTDRCPAGTRRADRAARWSVSGIEQGRAIGAERSIDMETVRCTTKLHKLFMALPASTQGDCRVPCEVAAAVGRPSTARCHDKAVCA